MDSLLAAGMLPMRDQVQAVYFNVKPKSRPKPNPNHNLSVNKNHTPYPNADPNTNKCQPVRYAPTSQCKCEQI